MVPKIVILPGSVRMCPRVSILVFLRLSPARLSCKWQIECWCDSVPVPGAASNTLSLWFSIRPPGMTSYLMAWVCSSVWFSCSVYSLKLLTTQPACSCSGILRKQMCPSFVVLPLSPSLWKSCFKMLHPDRVFYAFAMKIFNFTVSIILLILSKLPWWELLKQSHSLSI